MWKRVLKGCGKGAERVWKGVAGGAERVRKGCGKLCGKGA